jgi:CheY-like chemotaxis protein
MSASSSMTRTREAFIPFSYFPEVGFPTSAADIVGMARILISEPHPDLRVLLEAVVRRAGHEPVGHGELTSGDAPAVMILEPASAECLAAAARLRRRLENLPIICASTAPASDESRALGPVAHLIKPFRLRDLEAAIVSALAA